jgi:hypothetical protein
MPESTRFGRADLHMHTTVSDGAATVRDLLDLIERRGHLDVVAITDHDRLDATWWAVENQNRYSFDIVPGVEVSSAQGHVLGLWVTQPIPKNLSLAETAAAIHEQDGIAVLAHPYHIHMGIVRTSVFRYTLDTCVLLDAGIDAIEVHNAGILLPGANLMARLLARRAGLAATGSSDAHTPGAVGSGVTRFQGRTAPDLRCALEGKTTFAEGRAWPLIDYWNYSRRSTLKTSNESLAGNLS